MTNDIKKAIKELKAKAIMDQYGYYYHSSDPTYAYREGFESGLHKGTQIVLSKWEESTRWRKVEEELPPLGQLVWLKDENAERDYSKYDSGVRREYDTQDGWYWDNVKITKKYTHWQPIH